MRDFSIALLVVLAFHSMAMAAVKTETITYKVGDKTFKASARLR